MSTDSPFLQIPIDADMASKQASFQRSGGVMTAVLFSDYHQNDFLATYRTTKCSEYDLDPCSKSVQDYVEKDFKEGWHSLLFHAELMDCSSQTIQEDSKENGPSAKRRKKEDLKANGEFNTVRLSIKKKKRGSHGKKEKRLMDHKKRLLKRFIAMVQVTRVRRSTASLPHSTTGWQGKRRTAKEVEHILEAWNKGQLRTVMERTFAPVHYQDRPFLVLSVDKHLLLLRTTIFSYLVELHAEFVDVLTECFGTRLARSGTRKDLVNEIRGEFCQLVIGLHRQSRKTAAPSAHDERFAAEVKKITNTSLFRKLIGTSKSVMELFAPGCVRRFQASAKWHAERGHFPQFGYFWNCSINIPLSKTERVHCKPHVDSKNPVALCLVYVFDNPSIPFDHSRKSWLAFWELELVFELPPGVMCLFPSSLLFHFNVDIDDFCFVTSLDGQTVPTKETAVPLGSGGACGGRGSVVFYNQASMFQSSETGFDTLAEAQANGVPTVSDFERIVRESFCNPLSL